MEPTKEQIDAAYRERVLRARAMTGWEKVLEGFRLFEESCQKRKEEIRKENPDADEERVNQLLIEELEQKRREEEKGRYFRIPMVGPYSLDPLGITAQRPPETRP